MLEDDKKKLESLVKKYGVIDLLKTLSAISLEEANTATDLSLKDKSANWSLNADILNKICVMIKE